jgi:uncharacterized protein YukE
LLLHMGEKEIIKGLFGEQGQAGGGLFGGLLQQIMHPLAGSTPAAAPAVASQIPGIGAVPASWVTNAITSRDLPPLPGGLPNGMDSTGGILGLIRQHEGTAGPNGYNTTLGNGMFLPGGREQNLSGMTVDQVNRLGFGILNNPANKYGAGPMGAYQITPTTMMDLRKSMHLSGDELFDKPMQDSMALELMKERGTSTDALRGTWAGLNKVDPATIQASLNASSHQIATGLDTTAKTVQHLGQLVRPSSSTAGSTPS